MKPTRFGYHRPDSTEAVTTLLAEHNDVELLAGNQSSDIAMADRLATPAHVVDLKESIS